MMLSMIQPYENESLVDRLGCIAIRIFSTKQEVITSNIHTVVFLQVSTMLAGEHGSPGTMFRGSHMAWIKV